MISSMAAVQRRPVVENREDCTYFGKNGTVYCCKYKLTEEDITHFQQRPEMLHNRDLFWKLTEAQAWEAEMLSHILPV